jgi:hypothetical protein
MDTQIPDTFRFLDLPTDIRLEIYEKYFEGSQLLIQDARGHETEDPAYQRWDQRWDHYWAALHENAEVIGNVKTKKLPLALTQTSSQIRAESRPILAAATHLYIVGLEVPLALHLVPAYFRSHIKHLTLSMLGSMFGWLRFRLEILEPADLPSLKTLTMHYEATSEYGPGLDFPLVPGFDNLKHFNDFRADPLHRDEFRRRMRDLGVHFSPLAQLSQVAPFDVKLQVHTERFWSLYTDEDQLWLCACLVSSSMDYVPSMFRLYLLLVAAHGV